MYKLVSSVNVKGHFNETSNKIFLQAFAAVLSVAAALPLEDTVEVKAAKDAFHTVYKSVEAGEHIALRPVNNDVQAPQIANMYLDDTADVAQAKEAFLAEFKNVEAGGLMAKQAPAPVHEVAEVAEMPAAPVVQAAMPAHVYTVPQYYHNYYPHVYHMPTVYNLPRVSHVYNTVPVVAHQYALTYPYVMPVVQQEAAVEEKEVEMA